MKRVIAPAIDQKLHDARTLLGELRDALERFGAADGDRAAMASSIRQLDELFLLVVVGEFNAGKSAFINALVGEALLEEGVTPTTAHLYLLEYGDALGSSIRDGVRVLTAPVPLLRDIRVVDTPGTNAIHREHERLTSEFVPRADLVLFVTSADRPFTETERAFLAAIRAWGKKIVIVINKVDILRNAAELEQVDRFVRESAQRLIGIEPEVFPVSARLAWRAKQGEPVLWVSSGFDTLERFIETTLEEESRLRLKLANPLGVGEALAARYAIIADERLALIGADLHLLDDVDRQLHIYKNDLARGFELRMTAVEKALVDMESRGHAYFEDTLRLGRVFDLLNRPRILKEFEDVVVADAPRQVERRVSELIDWLIDQDFRQWQAVTERINERRRTHQSRILGAPDVGRFHADRTQLIESVGRETQRVVETYDKRREAEAIADSARNAVAAAAAAGGAALGLGTLVTLAASTAAADVTGLLMTSVVATLGLLVIPTRRRKAKAELNRKVSALRERLTGTLRTEFDQAVTQSSERIARVVEPYSRFVRAEQKQWGEGRTVLAALRERSRALLDDLAKP